MVQIRLDGRPATLPASRGHGQHWHGAARLVDWLDTAAHRRISVAEVALMIVLVALASSLSLSVLT